METSRCIEPECENKPDFVCQCTEPETSICRHHIADHTRDNPEGHPFSAITETLSASVPVILDSFDWKLSLPLSNNYEISNLPEAELKIKLSDESNCSFSYTRDQLHEFFMNLEIIQSQIDSLI
ncbi:unnamed protein product [Blepharisma stoltei]|uniref:COMM domain-containing protein n=1 Tax=Blepharisma stoltei TaxID=1481888 RepID=A0AAU9JN27_9CILI|nr:unnamed protein product [Blepharisma stoltei]